MSEKSKSVFELGLMGGMFDPVHNGHLNIALSSLEKLHLDTVHLIPCGQPVHRDGNFASKSHRLAMLELAVAGYSNISIDDRECKSKALSFTMTSLQGIRRENPDVRLYYIMGLDAFNAFDSWYRWQDIFSLAHIIIAARPGYELSLAPVLQKEFEKRQVSSEESLRRSDSGKIFISEFELLDISSSMVREKISRQESLETLMPEKVINYIKTHKLYMSEEVS